MATGTGGRVGVVLALVAASAIIVVAIAVVVGLSSGTPALAPSAAPTATAGLRLEYRVLPVNGVAPGPDDLTLVADALRARLEATGVSLLRHPAR